MALDIHITPTELLQLAPFSAVPPAEIPGDDPGIWSAVASSPHVGGGSMALGGYPIDALAISVACTVPGEIGVATFQATRGGILLSPVVSEVNPDLPGKWRYQIPLTGVTAELRAGAAPSFLAGDVYSFTTTASQRLLKMIAAGSALCDQYLRNQYANPEERQPGPLEKLYIAIVVRQWLLGGRGLQEAEARQQDKLFDQAMKHFMQHSKGDLRAAPGEQTDAPWFPNVMRPRDPYPASRWH